MPNPLATGKTVIRCKLKAGPYDGKEVTLDHMYNLIYVNSASHDWQAYRYKDNFEYVWEKDWKQTWVCT